MTTDLIKSLNAATDSLGEEHSAAVRSARSQMRCTYIHARALVTGTTEFDPIDLVDMDALDRMVGRWMNDAESAREASITARDRLAAALAPEKTSS